MTSMNVGDMRGGFACLGAALRDVFGFKEWQLWLPGARGPRSEDLEAMKASGR